MLLNCSCIINILLRNVKQNSYQRLDIMGATEKKNDQEKIENKQMDARCKFFHELASQLSSPENSDGMLSDEVLTKVNDACKFGKGYYLVLFTEGKEQIASGFETWQDEMMLAKLKELPKLEGIRAKIAKALEIRLMDIISKEAMLVSSSFFLMPENLLAGTKAGARTCDVIWRYAGDKSTDFNYYTKRGLLLTVYASARTFYFADNSKDHEQTRQMIRESLDKVVEIAGAANNIKDRIRMPGLEDIPIFRMFS